MKKLFISVAFLFATLLSNAQIVLEQTLTNVREIYPYSFGCNVKVFADEIYKGKIPVAIGDYLILKEVDHNETSTYYLYNLNNYSLDFFVNIQQTLGEDTDYRGPYLISRNIFTTDSKFAYICTDRYETEIKIISQDGNIIKSIPFTRAYADVLGFYLVKVGERYKLIVLSDKTDYNHTYDIYSLPGNGEYTAVNEVSTPHRNARKYIHDAQVFIENEKNIYTIQGQEIK